ncbi:MAG: YfhO family protein [Ignavibacteria bacterium]|nr:YfhO family protein [Ignavibacteria bacterium]
MGKQSKTKGKVTLVVKPPKDFGFFIVFLIFLLTTFIFFADQIFLNSFFWEDFTEYVFPVQSFSAKVFAKGTIPFWNPFTFAGMPFLADIQVGFFYIFNRILSLFTLSGNNLPVFALELMIILHFLFSQINSFFLARFLKISTFGSIITAISYTFSMMMVAHIIHPMIVYHLAWLPLILLFYLKSFDEDKIYYSILAGLVLGLTILSGHPQTTLYLFTLLAISGIYQIIFYLRNHPKILQTIRAFVLFVLPFLIGIGIFAIQLLPSVELSKYAQRAEVSYEKATEGALQFKQIYTAIVPKLFGWVEGSNLGNSTFYLQFGNQLQTHFFWETTYYFGVTAAILGLFAVLTGFRERYVWLMVVFVVFGFLYSLGDGSPIFNLMYNLPFYGMFRNPGRILFFVTLGMSVLGGLGFDYLWKEALKKNIIWKLGIPFGLAFIISILASAGTFAQTFNAPIIAKEVIEDSGNIALLLVLTLAVISFLLNRAVLHPALAGILIMVLCFVDLFLVGASFNRNPNNPEKIYELKPELKAMLTPKPPESIFRVSSRLYEPIKFMAMQRNQGLIDGIMLIDGYNPLILERVLPPINDAKTVNDLYNVRYEVRVDLEKSTWGFVEREGYFPRAWLVTDFVVKNPNEVDEFMRKNIIDYRKTVVLEKEPQFVRSDTTTLEKTSVLCLYYSENYFKYRISTPKSAILVLSEIWFPEWRAYIDGIPFEVYRANYCFRAVEIPKGEHILEMKFESKSFKNGAYISLFTLFLTLIGLVVFYRIEIGKHLHFIFKESKK